MLAVRDDTTEAAAARKQHPVRAIASPDQRRAAENPVIVGNSIARGGAFVYQRHGIILSLRPRFAPGPFPFENCCYGRSLNGARLLVAGDARQPSKKLAQVVIGDERAASELASHEVSVADCGVHGISAEAGERARLRDAVRAAAGVGNVLRHVCRPVVAVGMTATDEKYSRDPDNAGFLRAAAGRLSDPIWPAGRHNGPGQRVPRVFPPMSFRHELLQFPDELNKGGCMTTTGLLVAVFADAPREVV